MHVTAQDISFSKDLQASVSLTIADLLSRGQISSGQNVERFEQGFGAYLGASRCVAVSSGTAALELILQSLGVAGSTVLVPANTNFATYIAARRAGAAVRLVDVDPATLSPSADHIRDAITTDVSALVMVHMGGLISPHLEEIQLLCAAAGVFLVEDAAHAHGSWLGKQHAGTFGIAGAFSFFATKVLPIGEGGMVVTGDPNLAAKVSRLRNLGKAEPWVNVHTELGANFRMHEFAGVLGQEQLAQLPSYVDARRQIADCYVDALRLCSQIRLITPWHPFSGYKVVGYLAEGHDRSEVKQAALSAGVQLAGEIYEIPLHRQPVLVDDYAGHSFPGADYACARQICLPIYPSLTAEQISHVVEVLVKVTSHGSGSFLADRLHQ